MGYLFTPKFKLRNPFGKDERKGRRIAGQQKQNKKRNLCSDRPHQHITSTPRRQEVSQSPESSHPARVFLGKDWSLCSIFVLDFFTRFPTPGAPSPFPTSPAFSQLSGLSEEKGRIRSGTLCKNYMKISLSKKGEFCFKAAGLFALEWETALPPLPYLMCS